MIISFSETRRRYYTNIKVGKVVILDHTCIPFITDKYIKRKGYAEILPTRIRIDHTWNWNWVKFIYHTKIV